VHFDASRAMQGELLSENSGMPNLIGSTKKNLRHARWFLAVALSLCVAGLIIWTGIRVRANSMASLGPLRANWSQTAAASYLDTREAWWQSWPPAQLSQGTVCISCHTVLPYALARPGLRAELGKKELTVGEENMLSSIQKRVTDWATMDPYYTDAAHAEPSHDTEAVLNAVILAKYSTEQDQLAPLARRAFDDAWALQESAGANAGGWEWQDFHEAPWEAPEGAYQGAAMMAIALGFMPPSYASGSSVQNHVEQLRLYLIRQYSVQPTMNQLYVLWASATMPGLLSDSQRADLIAKVSKLHRPDGGWSLSSLDEQKTIKKSVFDLFKRASNVNGSDGVATGLVVLALEKTGAEQNDPVLRRGIAWLEGHQYEGGNWWASSMNGFRNPTTGIGRFMSDAATGYAVLALEQATIAQSAWLPAIEDKESGARKTLNASRSAQDSRFPSRFPM
jgi:squalene-hopene/tetraprenyl-beta-curcumene cyclase